VTFLECRIIRGPQPEMVQRVGGIVKAPDRCYRFAHGLK